MKRIMLTVAYDGTNYSGWQIQPDKATIEGVLNAELSRLLGEEIRVIGASRTDTGVHANGAIAVFDTNSRIPGEKFSYALNQSLPEDIRIRRSKEVAADFHPRRMKTKKTYEYRIWHDEFPLPTNRLYTHWVYTPLNVEAMRAAAAYFIGEHDFRAFCSAHTQAETTVRTIFDLQIAEQGNLITIRVCGNGFLYHMVRIIAGTLLDIGQGRQEPEAVKGILLSGDRSMSGPTAPAKGLCLIGYEFK
ncbi:MAG TPA: tRNA pseudouridine(38-40) synthase TruA [Lachnospiraceae bacterium]|nr:tRNA pseudouridine(38-40) synthase TruA [Lachnospiraceae bacterium]